MDRIEKPRGMQSEFANQGELLQPDPAAMDTPTGREDHLGVAEAGQIAASDIKKPIGAQPRSEITGAHDPGSDANETEDGLNDTEEALRRAAEDSPSGGNGESVDDIPVFDRADSLPKI